MPDSRTIAPPTKHPANPAVLKASCQRRRVLRSWKKAFQPRAGSAAGELGEEVEGWEDGAVDVDGEAEAVEAARDGWRRIAMSGEGHFNTMVEVFPVQVSCVEMAR